VRKKIALAILVIAIVIGARFLFTRPVDATLLLTFGPTAPSLREATLVFTAAKTDRVVRELTLRYAHGAPLEERRAVRLLPGDYTVGARLLDDTHKERSLSRTLRIDAAGTYPIDLAP
jgi:hypothetical protein